MQRLKSAENAADASNMEAGVERVTGFYLDSDGVVLLVDGGEIHLGLAELEALADDLQRPRGGRSGSRRSNGRARCDRARPQLRRRAPRDLCARL